MHRAPQTRFPPSTGEKSFRNTAGNFGNTRKVARKEGAAAALPHLPHGYSPIGPLGWLNSARIRTFRPIPTNPRGPRIIHFAGRTCLADARARTRSLSKSRSRGRLLTGIRALYSTRRRRSLPFPETLGRDTGWKCAVSRPARGEENEAFPAQRRNT